MSPALVRPRMSQPYASLGFAANYRIELTIPWKLAQTRTRRTSSSRMDDVQLQVGEHGARGDCDNGNDHAAVRARWPSRQAEMNNSV